MSSLEQWLRDEASQGRLDSQGAFTIDPEKAWAKLGASQLPFPEAWVLKLVQTAVSVPGSSLRIQIGRAESVFRFSGLPPWSEKDLQEVLFLKAHQPEAGLSHFSVAVRTLVAQRVRPFSLQFADGSISGWTGSTFVDLPPIKSREAVLQVTVAHYEFGQSRAFFSGDYRHLAAHRASLGKALSDHCHLSPPAVSWGAMKGVQLDPFLGRSRGTQPLVVLKGASHDSLPEFILHDRRLPKISLGTVTVSLRHQSSERTNCRVAVLLSIFTQMETRSERFKLDRMVVVPAQGRSQVLWLKDGVVVQRESLHIRDCVGIGLLLSADGLDTDLSGLRPRESDRKRERFRLGLIRAREMLSELKPEAREETIPFFRSSRIVPGAVAVLGGALLFSVPVLGVAALAKSSYDFTSLERDEFRLNELYNQGFSRLVQRLRERAAETV